MRLLPLPELTGGLWVEVDAEAVAVRVADRLLASLTAGQTLGLATGRTMVAVYAALRQRLMAMPSGQRRQLVNRWRSFNLDEYVGLGPDDQGSFAHFMGEQLANPLELPSGSLRIPNGLALDPALEARAYAQALALAGGVDLQVLGLGNNGHIGFNEPPCPIDARCRCLVLSAATRLQNAMAFGGHPEAVPARAITLGTAEILAAREVLLVVTGAAKAEILKRCLLEPPQAALPASWLRRHPRFCLVIDEEAASELRI
ncbi:MAG: glucosamine-6-phosphate deaminase [Vulcanococcus sp.]